MKIQEIKAIAKVKGIKTGNLKKTELIRTIQRAEGNLACYGTEAFKTCNQSNCLWREDCLGGAS